MINDFLQAFVGGVLLGLAVIGYLLIVGKIAGISGLIGQVLQTKQFFQRPAFWFLMGIFIIPFIYQIFTNVEVELSASPIILIIAGLLVGFGTRLGSGCTSGHGICGISRLSKRSMIATLTFMLTGFVTVFITRHVIGG